MVLSETFHSSIRHSGGPNRSPRCYKTPYDQTRDSPMVIQKITPWDYNTHPMVNTRDIPIDLPDIAHGPY